MFNLELNRREREISSTIFSLITRLEEAQIEEITDEDVLISDPSEEELEADVAYEPLEAPERETFTLEYICRVLEFKDISIDLDNIWKTWELPEKNTKPSQQCLGPCD
uniref:Uncharacterized protein n=1 Tax=Tetranychus urticae TaxID=32264 RepID=T1L095_TETUR